MTEDISQLSALTVWKELDISRMATKSNGMRALTNVGLTSTAAFCLGLILQIVAYQNIEAPFAGIFFLLLGSCIFHRISPLGGRHEINAFLLFFSVCYFWSGVAGIYSVYLDDVSQKADASWFFDLASGMGYGLTLFELRGLTEGSGAVFMWRAIYDLVSSIGFQKGPYIAVAFNTFLVSIAGVFAIKTVRVIFSHDQHRVARFLRLFTMCGVFWLFAAILLRDSSVLLLNTLLVYVWVCYLMRPQWATAVLLVVFSVISTAIFEYLRTEFFFVPVVMRVAGAGAIFVQGQLSRLSGVMSMLLIIGVLGLFIFILPSSPKDLADLLVSGHDQYAEMASDDGAGHGSLGMAYVVNQPIPVRLAIGSFYLQVFPIPFWSGLYVQSIYHLLKSLNAIFMWFVVPLAILGVRRSLQVKEKPKKAALVFLTFVYAGFTVAIAGTSLETRHLGAFLVPLLIVATVPDLMFLPDVRIFRRLLSAWLGLIMFIHIGWVILKVF